MEERVKIEVLRPLMEECFDKNLGFTFNPGGVSMLPFIRGGSDSVTIKRFEGKAKKYDIVFFRRADGKYIMHRVIGKRDGKNVVCGDNQYICELVSDDMIFSIVTGVQRGDRELKMKGFLYAVYCRTLFLRRFYLHVCRWMRYHFKRGRALA